MDIRIKDASAKELKELMETFASLGGAPTQQQQLPQQNLHQSVEIQKIQHDIGQLAPFGSALFGTLSYLQAEDKEGLVATSYWYG